MEYKILTFEIKPEFVSTGFFSGKTIPVEDKIAAMQAQINELASDGWRVNQMSTNPIIHGGGTSAGVTISNPGYNVVVIMEKEQLK